MVFMTEGILLRMMASDPMLSGFDVIVIDEVGRQGEGKEWGARGYHSRVLAGQGFNAVWVESASR